MLKLKTYLKMKKLFNGFPVGAKVTGDSFAKIYANKKAKKNKNCPRHHNHAEFQAIEDLKDVKNIVMLITTIPCFPCLQELKKLDIKAIYYMFDPWRKAKRDNWLNLGFKLERFEPKNDEQRRIVQSSRDLLINRYKTKKHEQSWKCLNNNGITSNNI